jgi:hypothetical protein
MRNIIFIIALTGLIAACNQSGTSTDTKPVDSTAIISKGMSALPSPLNRNYGHGKFHRVAVELRDGSILIAGGYTYDDMSRKWGILPTELYDTTSRRWTVLSPLVKGTQGQDKIFLLPDGRVFFKYGVTADGISLDYGLFYFSIYNPLTKNWEMKYNPASFDDRSPIQDCCLMNDGRVFIITPDYHYTWDPVSDTYSARVKNTFNATYSRCVLLACGEVLVCGGLGSTVVYPTDLCFLYPSYKISKMLSRKSGIDLVATPDNKAYILLMGNEKSNGAQNTSHYQYYDYATNTWNPIYASLDSYGQALSQGSVLFPSNKCFVMSESFNAISFALFDFQTMQPVNNYIFHNSIAPIARHGASLLALRNGKIFVLGYDQTNARPECYVYDSGIDYP